MTTIIQSALEAALRLAVQRIYRGRALDEQRPTLQEHAESLGPSACGYRLSRPEDDPTIEIWEAP